MELGWIDFSRTERDKVMGVMDLLKEPGVLDELGIGPIRDAFADSFFPGTSTVQTRAKYFVIVPYAIPNSPELARSSCLILRRSTLTGRFAVCYTDCTVAKPPGAAGV